MFRLILIVLLLTGSTQQGWQVESHGQGQIDGAVWLADGHTLAAVGARGIWLYDGDNPDAAPRLIESRRGWMRSVASGGAVLASGHHDGSITLWDSSDFREAGHIADGTPGPLIHLAISQDGARLIAASQWGAVRVWDTTSQAVLMTLDIPQINGVFKVAISGDGRRVAIASGYLSADAVGDGVIQIWDADQQQQLAAPEDGFFFPDMDFSADGRWLVISPTIDQVRFWDVDNSTYRSPATVAPDSDTAAFSADGQTLVVYNGFELSLWKTGSWEPVATIEPAQYFTVADLQVGTGYAAFTGSDERHIKGLWLLNLDSGAITELAVNRQLTGVFLQDDRIVARTAQREFGRAEFTWLDNDTTVESATNAMLSHDGRWLAWLNDDGLHLQNAVDDTEQVLAMAVENNFHPLLAFSPDSRLLAASTSDNPTIAIWELASGELIQTLEVTLPHDLAWSATHLAASSAWGVWLWSTEDWDRTTITLTNGYLTDTGVALGTDRLVVWDKPFPGYSDYTGFALYSAALDAAELRPLVQGIETWTGLDAALCPDERCVAVAASDGAVRLYDLANGRETDTLHTRQGKTMSALFDLTGQLIVGTESGLVQVWTVD